MSRTSENDVDATADTDVVVRVDASSTFRNAFSRPIESISFEIASTTLVAL